MYNFHPLQIVGSCIGIDTQLQICFLIWQLLGSGLQPIHVSDNIIINQMIS